VRQKAARQGEARTMGGIKDRLNDARSAAEEMKSKAEAAETAAKEAAERLAGLKKESEGRSIQLNEDEKRMRTELADVRTKIAFGESNLAKLEREQAELAKMETEKQHMQAEKANSDAALQGQYSDLQKSLEEQRSLATQKQQQAEGLRSERDTLSDELAGLKAEVEELTVSHDLEVERLQERLGQLQTVQDKLELSLSEKRKEHEKALLDMETTEEQKGSQLTESSESAMFNLKESQTMLRDAKTALKKEQKAKSDAEEIAKDTKQELEDCLKESRQKESELQAKICDDVKHMIGHKLRRGNGGDR